MRRSQLSVLSSFLVLRAAIGLFFVLGCSRTEPQAASVKAQPLPTADRAQSPTAQAAAQNSAPSSATPAPSAAAAVPADSAASSAISAEVSVDGKRWEPPASIKVQASSLWIGFSVQVESAQGERLTIDVDRGAANGPHLKGNDIDAVVLVRGKETWRKQGDQASAEIRSRRDDGPQPVLSLDWTATLRKEGGGAGKSLRVEARVANVPVARHPGMPEYGLSGKGKPR